MHFKAVRQMAFFLAVSLLAGSLLAACGQKGPLYLPEKNQQQNDKTQGHR